MKRCFECLKIVLIFYSIPQYWKNSWPNLINRLLWILGTIWLIISLIHFFINPSPIPQSSDIFWQVLFGSTVAAIITTVPPLCFSEKIEDKDVAIKILIGDVFNQKGDIVLSTNSTFDTTFDNEFISPKSLQGQLSKREYDKIEHLDQEIDEQLIVIDPILIHKRTKSKQNQYEIGTIIKLNHRSGFRSYWVAMADVNEHGKPCGKFENLQICLESLWRFMGEKGHMNRLILPILGSGRTGINESRFTILKEIIFSFVAFAKEQKITEELTICIHPSDIKQENIDIYDLKKYLNFQCRYRYESKNGNITSLELS